MRLPPLLILITRLPPSSPSAKRRSLNSFPLFQLKNTFLTCNHSSKLISSPKKIKLNPLSSPKKTQILFSKIPNESSHSNFNNQEKRRNLTRIKKSKVSILIHIHHFIQSLNAYKLRFLIKYIQDFNTLNFLIWVYIFFLTFNC